MRRTRSQIAFELTRREALGLGLMAGLGAGMGPFIRTAGAQAFNWQRYRGKELYLIFTKHPWTETIVAHFPEFEALTGIKLRYEVLVDIQARQKAMVELTSGTGGLDVFLSHVHVEKRRFWKAGWYEPLNRYIEDKALTAPDFDWNDFSPSVRALVTQPDNTVSALPCVLDPTILYYRKDLLQEKGLKPPKTLDELEAVAQKLHDPPRIYGLVGRGLKNANVAPFSFVMYAFGGQYLTPDRKSALNTPAWTRAVDWYAGNVRRFGPPGVVNYNWYECSSAFMQGQVATYFDGIAFAPQFEDKEKSKVAGKVAYVTVPAGPAGLHTSMFNLALAISAQSKNKEAAWFFVQWALSKENCIQELLSGIVGGRASIWNHPGIKEKGRMPPDWSAAFQEGLRIGKPALPDIIDVTQCRDIIGLAIQKAIEGQTTKEVLAQAHRDFQRMLDETEK